MKKLLLTTMLMALVSTGAMAQSFPDDGIIPQLGLDFAMQSESDVADAVITSNLNSAVSGLENDLDQAVNSINYQNHVMMENLESGIAGAVALASLPQVDGGFAAGVGVYESGSAMALGVSDYFEGGVAVKAGMSIGNKNNVSAGAGIAFDF